MGEKRLQNDLTRGGVWQQLVRFALPLMATSLLQALYSIVDTVVAGHVVGNTGISAIANAGQILTMLTQIAIGLTTGGNVLLGQYFGRRDEENLRRAAGTLFAFSLCLGLCFSILVYVLTEPILTLLKAPAYQESCDYLRICAPGVLVTFGYNALSATIRAKGNSRQPLYFIAAATVINIGLDIWFVAGLGWGVAGTAWATLAAQVVSFLCALGFVLKNGEFSGFRPSNLRVDWKKLRLILKVGVPSALQMIVGGLSWTVVLYFTNKYDVDVSAAAGTANKIRETMIMAISALSAGAATMVAQNLGVGHFDRAKRVVYVALGINLALALLIIGVEQLWSEELASVFTSNETAIYYASRHLRIESICFVFYAGFMSLNAMAIGAGYTLFILFNSFMNCIAVRVVLVVILERAMGLDGIYWACGIAPAISVPIGMIYLRSGVWRRSRLVQQ